MQKEPVTFIISPCYGNLNLNSLTATQDFRWPDDRNHLEGSDGGLAFTGFSGFQVGFRVGTGAVNT